MDSSFTQKLVTNKKKNYFPTVFNALSIASTDGIIKVNTGLYNENL